MTCRCPMCGRNRPGIAKNRELNVKYGIWRNEDGYFSGGSKRESRRLVRHRMSYELKASAIRALSDPGTAYDSL